MAKLTKDRAASKANRELDELVRNKYFSAIPLDRIYDIVETSGLSFMPEDKECILCGREGRATWDLRWNNKSADKMLVLSWYKMPSGKYEVVPYIS